MELNENLKSIFRLELSKYDSAKSTPISSKELITNDIKPCKTDCTTKHELISLFRIPSNENNVISFLLSIMFNIMVVANNKTEITEAKIENTFKIVFAYDKVESIFDLNSSIGDSIL